MAHLLVVDDEPSARSTLALLLRKRGHRVLEAEGVASATTRLAEELFDLVVTDLRVPDGDGLDVLRTAKAQAPATEVILLTAYAEWKSAKEAIRLGALDYFEKGQEPDELYHRIDKALAGRALRRENENLRAQLRERYGLPGLIAQSPAMHTVLDLVERVAPTDATLLIQGESATGEASIAEAAHHAGRRQARPSAAARSARGHSGAGRAFPRAFRRQAGSRAAALPRDGGAAAPLRVAGQRARAGERDRARGHPGSRRHPRADGPAAARIGGPAARPLASAPAANDTRRGRARAHPADPGALRTQPLERRRSARDRPHHALEEA